MWSVYYGGGPEVACHVFDLYCGDPGVWSATCFCVFEHHGGDNSGGVSGYTWYRDDGPHLSEPGQ